LCLAVATGKLDAMSGIFASLTLEGRRIRPQNYAFNDAKIGPNSR
jgi:hypothetical protein